MKLDGLGAATAQSSADATVSARVPSPRDVRGLPGLAGASAPWQQMCSAVVNAASRRPRSPLLLMGEAGVGKSAIARAVSHSQEVHQHDAALHHLRPREWMRALAEYLTEGSEHVVIARHLEALNDAELNTIASLLEAADKEPATLIGTYEPAEGKERKPVYRLAPVIVEVPALRDRLDDIPLLVDTLTRRHSPFLMSPAWSPEAIRILRRANWVGNVAELESLVKRVLIEYPSRATIRACHLPVSIVQQAVKHNLSVFERSELATILASLKAMEGNKASAAHHLGISRATIYRKARYYGIEPPQFANP